MTETKAKGNIVRGVVTSTKMDKTAVVSVTRFVKHPKYKKFLKITKKFKAHDADNSAVVGAQVSIRESRPFSKDTHFEIVK